MAQTQPAEPPALSGGVVLRPQLFERLSGAGRVTLVSAPAGSGKTLLLRSWIDAAQLGGRAGWVSVERGERDPERFWVSVLDALRRTAAGSTVVSPLTVAPELDGWQIVERLLADVAALEEPIWLVVDDLHELRSEDALRQFELLLMRAPSPLRFVLCTRQDMPLGLHRLRLEGGLSEIRVEDLRFTAEEAGDLLARAGVKLSGSTLAPLHERTEGWAAGLRLAAMSLARHPDPARFAAEFAGSERTVAEYLLAEVVDQLPQEVRRLLLRTSILERVSGSLADALTGGSAGERILLELEQANAFVVSLDARRSWFRYHHLFAELLQMELRRAAPDELRGLHSLAADWYGEHGYPIEAVRHAQAAEDWCWASRLLVENSLGLYLGGRLATVHELLAAFPASLAAADPELASVAAASELNGGSLEAAERHLAISSKELPSLPKERRRRLEVILGLLRLSIARQRGDLTAVIAEAQRVLVPIESAEVDEFGMTEERRAMALISLGSAELWAAPAAEAERHLEQGIAIARQIEHPYLVFTGLAHLAQLNILKSSFGRSQELSVQAIELAERHGWTESPTAALAYAVRGGPLVFPWRLEEAELWLDRAERSLQEELEPAAAMGLHTSRGALELARGQHEQALESFRAAERLAQRLITPHMYAGQVRSTRWLRLMVLQTLVQMGQHESVEQALADLDEEERDSIEIRTAIAMLRLGQNDPEAAATVLATIIDHPDLSVLSVFAAHVWLLNANAQHALGATEQAERSLEHALDIAEPGGLLWPFLVWADRGVLERHPPHRTAHRALLSEILNLLDGKHAAAPAGRGERLREPLSETEARVLRYLPTNLSASQIADELYVSVYTVRTHVKHMYAKLDVHDRAEAVERARALGLLAPSLRRT